MKNKYKKGICENARPIDSNTKQKPTKYNLQLVTRK